MAIFTDNFAAADGTPLDGYNGWHRRAGDANTATIVGQRVTVAGGGVAMFLSPAAPTTSNYIVSATLTVPAGGPGGMVAGLVGQASADGATSYCFLLNSLVNQMQLYAFKPDGTTSSATYNVTLGPGDYAIELDLRPSQQTGKLNGAPVCSMTDTTVPANSNTGITFNRTGGNVDLISAFSTADANPKVLPDDVRLANAYSPLQWRVTSSGAVATILGSEINFTFTGTSCALGLDLSHWSSAAGGYPVLAYSIDNGPQTEVQLTAGQTSLPLASGLASANHTVKLVYLMANNTSMSRWTDDGTGQGPACSLRITHVSIDPGSTVASTVASTSVAADLMLILGDSITECDFSAPASILVGDPRTDYSYHLGDSLGFTTSRLAYSGTGYTKTANDNVPPVGTYWKNFDSLHPRPINSVATNVKTVIVIHGVNDLAASAATVQSAAQSLYADLLAQLPGAMILVYIPFGQAQVGAITAAVAATASGRVRLRNLGSMYSVGLTNSGSATYQSADGTHPNTFTHALLRSAMTADLQAALGLGAVGATLMNTSHTVGGGVLCGQ